MKTSLKDRGLHMKSLVCHLLLRRDSGSSGAPVQAPRLQSGSDYARTVPLVALVLVTVVWGITFVQVKDAVAIYPLFAFLALRFAIGSLALFPFALARGRRGSWKKGAVVGVLLGFLVA